MPDALTGISTLRTHQSEQSRSDQVKNNAGGFVFAVDDLARLRRFLVLGTEGGTFYVGERELTRDNARVVIRMAQNDHKTLVDETVAISTAGRAPKNNQALFALAIACSIGTDEERRYAFSKLSEVARIGTHLLLFATYVQNFRRWGRQLHRGIGEWYLDKSVDQIAYQMVKYRSRGDWSHRDLLRKVRPKTAEPSRNSLFAWAVSDKQAEFDTTATPDIVQGYQMAQAATTAEGWIKALDQHPNLSWEMLPTQALNEPTVWHRLLEQGLPQTALMRQLPRLTRLGVIGPKNLALTAKVATQLKNPENLQKARVHPFNVLVAQRTYAQGYSERGTSTWDPSSKVTDALDAAYYAAYANVEPANKRTLLALDISGSMGISAGGLPLSCIEAEAALALVTLATEPEVTTIAFTAGGSFRQPSITQLPISPRQRLDDAIKTMHQYQMGGTDCALPMMWALKQNLEVDTFVTYTDSETWAGGIHPYQALKRYRQESGIDARMIVVGMASTGFSIADPDDAGSLDIVGMDSAVPTMISDFSAGKL